MFLPQEIIRRKRDGETLSTNEIDFFIQALTAGRLSEGQTAAFAMAVFFQGMSALECAALTRAMTCSGRVLDWSGEFLGGQCSTNIPPEALATMSALSSRQRLRPAAVLCR